MQTSTSTTNVSLVSQSHCASAQFELYEKAVYFLTEKVNSKKFEEAKNKPQNNTCEALNLINKLMPVLNQDSLSQFVLLEKQAKQEQITHLFPEKHKAAIRTNGFLKKMFLLVKLASEQEGFKFTEEQIFNIASVFANFFISYNDALKYIELNYTAGRLLHEIFTEFYDFPKISSLENGGNNQLVKNWKELWMGFLLDKEHSQEATQILPFANQIFERLSEEQKNSITTIKWDDIKAAFDTFAYKRFKENPKFALICSKAGNKVTEGQFNACLDTKTKPFDFLPEIEISLEIDGEIFTLKKLSCDDKRALIMGNFIGSCQSIGNLGYEAAGNAAQSPFGGIYYIITGPKRKIVAQSWVCISKEGFLVFNSFDSPMDIIYSKLNKKLFGAFMPKIADDVLLKGYGKVYVGMGGRTPFGVFSLCTEIPSLSLLDFPENGYRDSRNGIYDIRSSSGTSVTFDIPKISLKTLNQNVNPILLLQHTSYDDITRIRAEIEEVRKTSVTETSEETKILLAKAEFFILQWYLFNKEYQTKERAGFFQALIANKSIIKDMPYQTFQNVNVDLAGIGLNAPNINLSRADLSGVNLSGADLSGADLTGAILSGANLCGVILNGAILDAAAFKTLGKAQVINLKGVRLVGDFSGVNFSGFNLIGVNLSGANLSGAILSGANLCGVILNGAILDAAAFKTLAKAQVINLKGVRLVGDFSGVNFSGFNLIEVNFSGAILDDVAFNSLDKYQLPQINFEGVRFVGNFSKVDLVGGADLTKADLTKANLSEAEFTPPQAAEQAKATPTASSLLTWLRQPTPMNDAGAGHVNIGGNSFFAY